MTESSRKSGSAIVGSGAESPAAGDSSAGGSGIGGSSIGARALGSSAWGSGTGDSIVGDSGIGGTPEESSQSVVGSSPRSIRRSARGRRSTRARWTAPPPRLPTSRRRTLLQRAPEARCRRPEPERLAKSPRAGSQVEARGGRVRRLGARCRRGRRWSSGARSAEAPASRRASSDGRRLRTPPSPPRPESRRCRPEGARAATS